MVQNSVIMPNVTIKAGSVIAYAIVAEDCTIHAEARIGQKPEKGQQCQITVVGKGWSWEPGSAWAQAKLCAGETE